MARRPRLSLAQLEQMPVAELMIEWARLHGAPAPALPAGLLRLGLGYRLQEQRHGGLSRTTRALLRQQAKAARDGDTGPEDPDHSPPQRLAAGTKLVREWKGESHLVTVVEGGFLYEDRHWRSLTAIARVITGTHQSGPRFFDLEVTGK